MTITFFDCFAGAGGLSLGLSQAGLIPVYAFDGDPIASETHRRNSSATAETALIDDVDPRALVDRFGTPDAVVGGPPCQGFSTQRRGSLTDERNNLVSAYFRFALAVRPRVIVMENVPGVLGRRGKAHLSAVLADVARHNYEVAYHVVDATAVGVPQRRRRALIVAWDPTRAKPFDFAPFFDSPRKLGTVRSAIGDLPSPPADFSEHPDFRNHARSRISKLNLERITHVPPGGGRLDIPPALRLACHSGSDHRHLDVYGRLEWDQPAPTITAMFDSFTRGRFAHPREHRNITNREGARLQTFPDSYAFFGPKKDVARQIGNAVPPRLAELLGGQLLKQTR